MGTNDPLARFDQETRAYLDNVASNLQLVADLAYGAITLAVPHESGVLEVVADARPTTALAPLASTRIGQLLKPAEEPEAYAAFQRDEPAEGPRGRVARGIKYTTTAYPLGLSGPVVGVIVRDLADQVTRSPGTMEVAFMEAADEIIEALCSGPILDVRDGSSFYTVRSAGDGVLRVSSAGVISYASPNAVNIMRSAGVVGRVTGSKASSLPGGGFGISPVLGTHGAVAVDAEVGERVLGYRSLGLLAGALVLVEDQTEARRREAELRVKDATIREIHHRVKNNLQTIASLLRIQGRRTRSDEARHALAEATERVSAMAVVHDLLAGSDEERIDFTEAARPVVDLVCRSLAGEEACVYVRVTGSTGLVESHVATSLALVVAELVHNAIEHGFPDERSGSIEVAMRRVPGELVLAVRDDGAGLPKGFDPGTSANLGLEIVRTVVEDDLRGTLTFSGARGTTVTVRIPLAGDGLGGAE